MPRVFRADKFAKCVSCVLKGEGVQRHPGDSGTQEEDYKQLVQLQQTPPNTRQGHGRRDGIIHH